MRYAVLLFHCCSLLIIIQSAPEWLLEFVFRSLLTWVIYIDRRKSLRTNNLYSAVHAFVGSKSILQLFLPSFFLFFFFWKHKLFLTYIDILDYSEIQKDRLLGQRIAQFLTDDDYSRLSHNLLSSPDNQQRIFQWNDNQTSKHSKAIIQFLAQFFSINLRVLSESGAMLYETEAEQPDSTYVNITCGKGNYSCSYNYTPVPTPVLAHFSAFVHLSGRQLVHETMLFLIRRILDELRLPVFWKACKNPTQYPIFNAELPESLIHANIIQVVGGSAVPSI